MSDDPAVKRAVLREHGIEVPDRGRLSAEHEAAYDRLRQDAPAGDYDAGVTSADFDDDDEPGESATERDAGTEQTPRGRRGRKPRERRAAAKTTAAGLWGRARKAAAGGGGKRHKWIGTADVIEHFWSQLAWAARPVPPLQKILAAQAPTAGVILQDGLRDTLVDRLLLQPAARAEDRLQAVNAIAGPPLFTTLITAFGGALTADDGQGGQVPVLDQDGNYIFDDRTRMLVGGLRFSLMSWLKIAGKRAEEIKAAAEELTALGDEADELIRWILAPPEKGASPRDVEREAQRRGADFVASASSPERPAGPRPAEFASSAFSPRPSAGVSGGGT